MSNPAVVESHRLVGQWSDDIDACLADLIEPGTRVALVNFPNHANAGDPALWLGEIAALERIGAQIVYRASWSSYDPHRLRAALGDGVICIHGGANFGDLYPANQAATRERLLADLPDVRTIQLPQSVFYEQKANEQRMADLLAAHTDFTLLTREHDSLGRARAAFSVDARVCPDVAFALGPLERRAQASTDVLWLARSDPEAGGHQPTAAPGFDLTVLDWLDRVPDEPRWSAGDRLRHRLNRGLLARPETARRLWRLDAAQYESLAWAWTNRGCAVLARGRVVVTDRLHGHILALLQGIPHVVLDNSYGKLRAVYEGWTQACPLTHWAETADEAAAQAHALLE